MDRSWLLVTVLGLFVVIAFISAGRTTTRGKGGIKCGPLGKCLSKKTYCNQTTQECICRKKFKFVRRRHSGRLDCYKKNTRGGGGMNDPVYLVFDLEPKSYKYLLPCRVLFHHTTSDLKARGEGNVGRCECKTYSWNKKHLGKIYGRGVELTCRLDRTEEPTSSTEFTTRVEGYGSDGEYNFTEWGSYTFDDPNPTKEFRVVIDDDDSKIYYQSQYDFDQNFVRLNLHQCGIRVVFRPFDFETNGTYNYYKAGFSTAINCAYGMKYFSTDKVMSTGPVDNGGPAIETALLPGLDTMTSFMYRALLSGITQTQENPNAKCTEGAAAVSLCTTPAKKALSKIRCNFIFEHAHFIHCVDKTCNGEVIQELYNRCVTSTCDDGVGCSHFVSYLADKSENCTTEHLADVDEFHIWMSGSWTC